MSDIGQVEALLFVAGEQGLSINQLSQICQIPNDRVAACLDTLALKYDEDPDCGLSILNTAKSYKMVTKNQYINSIKRYARLPLMNKLSRSLIETLSIIAYKQPITRMEIEEIRGVSISNAIQKLKLRDLIEETGRLDGPGRPVLYGTTRYFLDYFALNDLADLPELESKTRSENTSLFD